MKTVLKTQGGLAHPVSIPTERSRGATIVDYYAHTATRPDGSPDPDQRRWQPLRTHLRNVANHAKDFATPLGLAEGSRTENFF